MLSYFTHIYYTIYRGHVDVCSICFDVGLLTSILFGFRKEVRGVVSNILLLLFFLIIINDIFILLLLRDYYLVLLL